MPRLSDSSNRIRALTSNLHEQPLSCADRAASPVGVSLDAGRRQPRRGPLTVKNPVQNFLPLNTHRRAILLKPPRESGTAPARIHTARRRGPASCGGAMLLILMFLVAFMGITLAVATDLWHIAAVREKEAQLLFVGGEYQRALARYKAATPAGMPTAPERLDQLLLDERQQVPTRHLRRLYRDPMTDSGEWGLVKEAGRITGIYSLGGGKPLKQAGFPAWAGGLSGAATYAAWRFLPATGDVAPVPKTGDSPDPSSVAEGGAEANGNRPIPAPAASDNNSTDQDTASRCSEAFRAALRPCLPLKFAERGRCRDLAYGDYRQCLGR